METFSLKEAGPETWIWEPVSVGMTWSRELEEVRCEYSLDTK